MPRLSHFLEISRLRFTHPLFGCVNQRMDSSRKWASRYHFNVTRRSVSTSRAATSITSCTILRRLFKLFTYSDPKFECAFLLLGTHLPFKLFTSYFSRSPRFLVPYPHSLVKWALLTPQFFTSTVVSMCLFCAEPWTF